MTEHSNTTPPILIIGMHRSGTSLLARLLESLGLFVGWRLAANHEASYFNKHNSWLLSSAGGRWDTPRAIDHLLADEAGVDLALDYLEGRLTSPLTLEFLGARRYLRYRSLRSITEPWGWKDPRTTITLPLWLRLFPHAKVLHLVRNGVDVAASLHRRQLNGRQLGQRNLEHHRRLSQIVAKQGWFGTSPRVASRSAAFQLWEEYLEYAERFTADLGERLLLARYENLLRNPAAELRRIVTFCGLQPEPDRLNAAQETIDPERASPFRHEPELMDLWHDVRSSPWMERHGYDQVPASG
ncbi:MAG: sulfotransferase [Acidobacteriota bacterium]